MGLREYKPINQRNIDDKLIEDTKKYYFVFEGSNTEVEYFKGVDEYSKKLGISNMIKLIILEKDESIKNDSAPIRLLQETREKKKELLISGEFEETIDEFVIVFDRDSFKPVDKKKSEYIDFIKEAEQEAILAVTSPCFELWLLLHYNKISFENKKKKIEEKDTDIFTALQIYYEEFRQNIKISGKHTFTSKAFSLTSGTNSKSNLNFEDLLLERIDNAITNEKSADLEKDIHNMVDKIGSNIGELIEKLQIDPRKNAD